MNSYFRQIAVILLFGLGVASGQVATGTPPFGSFGGGPFDIVNLGNLNVHFDIPIIHKAGRGMPFNYDVTYDSSIWTPAGTTGSQTWVPAVDWGWNSSAFSVGHLILKTKSTTTPCGTGHGKTILLTAFFTYVDHLGTPHSFSAQWGHLIDGCGGGSTTYAGSDTAEDGSGYTLNVTDTTVNSLTDKTGKVINAPVNASNGASSVTDANGNQISVSSTATFTDTLGTTALTIAGSAPTPKTFTYIGPSGAVPYTITYKAYTVATNFGITNIQEYGAQSVSLVDKVTLPDGTAYTFAYEPTPTLPVTGACSPLLNTYSTNCVTARIATIALPTGGTISYLYSGGSNGIFSDGSTAGMVRTLNPGGQWQYTRALQTGSPGTGSTWTTTIKDPATNYTVLNFAEDASTTNHTYNFYETQRQTYQGTVASVNLLATLIQCYNTHYTNCATATVSSQIVQTDSYTQLPNGTARLTERIVNSSGLLTDAKEYDYGVSVGNAPGTTLLIRETITTYASLGNIVDKPATIIVKDWSTGTAATLASTTYNYDAATPASTPVCPNLGCTPQHTSVTAPRGNLTSIVFQTTASATLSKSFTYYDTGLPKVASDVNGAQTTYVYDITAQGSSTVSCGNSFPTTINKPLGLSTSAVWDCNGGLTIQVTDENGKYTSAQYTDLYFWRPASFADQMTNQTNISYSGPTAVESALQNFNGGASSAGFLSTVDGFGRPTFSQRKQGTTGNNYDTVETDYDALGHPYRSTMPYTATASPTSGNTTVAAAIRTYDALGRTLTVTDAATGTITFSYVNNDVLETVSGAQSFQKQFEYDGLGRLKSVCEISGTLPGVSACGQSSAAMGYWTRYKYDALGHILGVCQATTQPSTIDCVTSPSPGQQTRTFAYDRLGRMTSESNPETGSSGSNGTTSYTYDSISPCGDGATYSYPGDLVQRRDNAGNMTCFKYDALHRVTQAGNTSVLNSTLRKFAYDLKTSYPTGVTVLNAKTHIVEAQTVNTSNLNVTVTDEYFSYSPRGEVTDVYESTPHFSSSFYHTTASYWPTGTVKSLDGIPGVPTIYYGGSTGTGLDAEGRVTKVTAASGTNPVNGVTYSPGTATAPLGFLTHVTFGSTDGDSFTYDPATGRMATYAFNVNGDVDKGTLTWNTNGTVKKLVINDQIPGTSDSQTCNYLYDDLQRISSANCGVLWTQNFTYDAFGNVKKTGNASFTPGYSATQNQFTSIPGIVSPYYDSTGNVTKDNLNTYSWDPFWGSMLTVSTGLTTVTAIYDAFGRMVENNAGGLNTEFIYGPTGARLAKVNGTTLIKAFITLPGGATAVYTSAGLAYYRHGDWLGSARLTSTATRTASTTSAYAAFGEQYAVSGTADPSFTEHDSDTVSSLYDFTFRENSSSQGRWVSPDPAGLRAVSMTYPQSWNRYAYVQDNPLISVDPLGLSTTTIRTVCLDGNDVVICAGGGGSSSGGGGGVPDDWLGSPEEWALACMGPDLVPEGCYGGITGQTPSNNNRGLWSGITIALNGVQGILAQPNECSQWLDQGAHELRAESALDILNSVQIVTSDLGDAAAAAMQGSGSIGPIYINPAGSAYPPTGLVRWPDLPYPAGSTPWIMVVLLHELGHKVSAPGIVSDTDNMPLSKNNTNTVLSHCQTQINGD